MREILVAIGEDPTRGGLLDTPKRVAKAYAEMFAGLHHDPAEILSTTFDLDHEELVLVKDILCIPPASITWCRSTAWHTSAISLSMKARSQAEQAGKTGGHVREAAAGAGVPHHPDHRSTRNAPQTARSDRCHRMRTPVHVHAGGIRKPGAKTVTSAVRGQLHDPATRAKPPASYSDGELRPSVCMALSPNWNSHL